MKSKFLLSIISIFFILTISCDNEDLNGEGTVTFGANFHIIDCITYVTVYVDGEELGTLQNSTTEITECNSPENLSKDLPAGKHNYLVEIRPDLGTGCTKDISGSFTLVDNECEKIFIDYNEIEF
jgi:hypothetical protein